MIEEKMIDTMAPPSMTDWLAKIDLSGFTDEELKRFAFLRVKTKAGTLEEAERKEYVAFWRRAWGETLN